MLHIKPSYQKQHDSDSSVGGNGRSSASARSNYADKTTNSFNRRASDSEPAETLNRTLRSGGTNNNPADLTADISATEPFPLTQLQKRSQKSRRKKDKAVSYRFPIAFKVSVYFMLPILVGMVVLAYIMIDAHRSFQHKQMDQFARVITEQLASSAVEPLFADANMELGVLINQVALDNSFIGSGIYNHLGEPIALSGVLPTETAIDLKQLKSIVAASLFEGSLVQNQADANIAFDFGVIYSSPIRFRNVTGGYAVVVFNESALASHFDQMAYALMATTVALFLLLTMVIFFMSRHVTAPLKDIANAAASIDSGNIAFIPERRNDELGQLIQSINRMGKDLARKSEVESVLEKFLAPDVANKIINEIDDVNFRGENVEATALFADIVGFTQMSENMTPEEVSELLNEYFGYYAACAKLYFGTVDKFLGDCVMLVFGAAKADPKHQQHAVACALLMQELTEKLNQKRIEQGLFPVYLRIGINSGKMLAGLLGSQDRLEYTVIGDSVNLASRLCNEAKQGQIIIHEQCYENLRELTTLKVDDHKTIKIRGKSEPVSIYNVYDMAQERSCGNKALIEDLLSQPRRS